MEIELYYFTGTGNTLVVARTLAEKLGARLLPVAAAAAGDIIAQKKL